MKWLTPDGHYIHGKGIKPDVPIDTPKYQSLNVILIRKHLKLETMIKILKLLKLVYQL